MPSGFGSTLTETTPVTVPSVYSKSKPRSSPLRTSSLTAPSSVARLDSARPTRVTLSSSKRATKRCVLFLGALCLADLFALLLGS
jgi:hypothetical protein